MFQAYRNGGVAGAKLLARELDELGGEKKNRGYCYFDIKTNDVLYLLERVATATAIRWSESLRRCGTMQGGFVSVD